MYLYLVIDVWSRKVVVWDVEECEDAKLADKLRMLRSFSRPQMSKDNIYYPSRPFSSK